MHFNPPLIEAIFLRRYQRFFADIQLKNGEVAIAHVPNTGSLLGCLVPQILCRVTHTNDLKRKLKYTLQMVQPPQSSSWVGVNTHLSNDLVAEGHEKKLFSQWQKFPHIQREVKISPHSRVDFVLWEEESTSRSSMVDFSTSNSSHSVSSSLLKPNLKKNGSRLQLTDFKKQHFHFVEVKNVTMAKNGQALFPDAVTTRGQKHLHELMSLIQQGHSAEIVYTVQREDCDTFAPAREIDQTYADLLEQSSKVGLKITALSCRLSPHSIELDFSRPLKVIV